MSEHKLKVSLRCNQQREYIEKADELYVPWKRRDILEEIHEQYPDKEVLLHYDSMEPPTEDELNDIKMYGALYRGNLKILTKFDYFENLTVVRRVLNYPMNSIYEMYQALEHGIEEFFVGPGLMHSLDKAAAFAKRFDCKLRVCVNAPDLGDAPMTAIGGYVLPQEINILEKYVDYVSFYADNGAIQETALYRIYIEDKYFGGNLQMIVPGAEHDPQVRMMEPVENKFRCNLGCLTNTSCHLCYRNVFLANPELYNKILDKSQDADVTKED